MADSSIAITAGSGTPVDTRTEGTNGNHRQVIVLGDPATNAGVAPVDATAGLKVNLGGDNDVTVTSITLPTGVVHGQKTVTTGGTEEALGSSTALTSGVTVKALHGNTGMVYVGANPVTSSTGFVLDAGESIFIETDNLADIYIDVDTNGEGVSYIGG